MSENNFSNYSTPEATADSSARITLYTLEGEPWFDVHPAGEVNKKYFNKLLRRNQKIAKSLRGKSVNTKVLALTRDSDRILYAEDIVFNWGKVINVDGDIVEFSKESAKAFFQALPAEEFDEVRAFATNMSVFTDTDSEFDLEEDDSEEDAGGTKNS